MLKPKTSIKKNPNRFVTANVLRKVSVAMLPFYKAIAFDQRFAAQWSQAVVKADLERMEKLLKQVAPLAAKQQELAANGIGYFVSFRFPAPIFLYTNGVTIPPGSVQFFFETRVHRAIACSVLPFYRKLAASRSFAQALAKAIRLGDRALVSRMVRSMVKTKALKSVAIEDSGVALLFKYSFSKFKYRNLLFRDVP